MPLVLLGAAICVNVAVMLAMGVLSGGVPSGEGGYVCVRAAMEDGSKTTTYEYDRQGRRVSYVEAYESQPEVYTSEGVSTGKGTVRSDTTWTDDTTCREKIVRQDDLLSMQMVVEGSFTVDDGRVIAVEDAVTTAQRFGEDFAESIGQENGSPFVYSDESTVTVEYRSDGSVASVTRQLEGLYLPSKSLYDEHGCFLEEGVIEDGQYRRTSEKAYQIGYDDDGLPVSLTVTTEAGEELAFDLETDEHGNVTEINDDQGERVATFEYAYIPNMSAIGRYQALPGAHTFI